MFDPRPALTDMAIQIRTCRANEGLTLQELATRSGVAASTIHKVETQHMIPTVSVLLKIAKGLDRRPEELVRDQAVNGQPAEPATADSEPSLRSTLHDRDMQPGEVPLRAGLWRMDLSESRALPTVKLDPVQRAIVLVESGVVDLQAGDRRIRMNAGDCVEVGGGDCIGTVGGQTDPARLTLIVSPPGNLDGELGSPSAPQPALG